MVKDPLSRVGHTHTHIVIDCFCILEVLIFRPNSIEAELMDSVPSSVAAFETGAVIQQSKGIEAD